MPFGDIGSDLVVAFQKSSGAGLVVRSYTMRAVVGLVVASIALAATPAMAEPSIKTSMPVIRATLAKGELVVRMAPGVLGGGQSATPRSLVVVARDAQGKVVYESVTPVSRRLTYARIAEGSALANADAVSVSIR
jgi:hypothetical protein